MARRSYSVAGALVPLLIIVALGLVGCTGVSGAQSNTPIPSASAAHVYYAYPRFIPLPSGAAKPNGGEAVALDAGSGVVAWRHVIGTPLFPPVEIDGAVYVSSYVDDPRTSTLAALDPSTGKTRWSHETPGTFANQPVVAGGAIYVSSHQQDGAGGFTGVMQALDQRSGAMRWQVHVDESPSPAVVDGNVVYLTGMGGVFGNSKLFALDAATGNVRWSYTSASLLTTLGPPGGSSDTMLPPMLSNGVVSVISTVRDSQGAAIQSVLALDAASGKVRWSYSTGGIVGAPVIVDGALYTSADIQVGNAVGSSVMALRMSDGTLLWRRELGSGRANVTFVDGQGSLGAARLLVITSSGSGSSVVALSPTDGHIQWTLPVGHTILGSPLLAGGLALIQAADQTVPNRGVVRLLALQPSDGKVRWRQDIGDWPAAGGDTPRVVGGLVFTTVTAYSGSARAVSVLALRISDGARQWQWRVGSQ